MHKHLSCSLSRLSASEPVAIVRVQGCLPGLHPIHLYWFGTRMTDVSRQCSANSGHQCRRDDRGRWMSAIGPWPTSSQVACSVAIGGKRKSLKPAKTTRMTQSGHRAEALQGVDLTEYADLTLALEGA